MRGPLLILIVFVAVVVVLAVVIGFVFASRSRKDAQRVEAAGIRADADALGATVAGQAAFAQQAEERAGIVRAEAEEKARQAELLESEAQARRDAAETARRDYEAELRRADEIDPDVDDSTLPPVEEAPQTRAERRAARDEAEAGRSRAEADTAPETTEHGAGAAAGAAAVGGSAAVGAAAAAADGTGRDEEHDDGHADPEERESARVASAADYRDDVDADDDEVYRGEDRGTVPDMSQTQHSTADDPTHDDHHDHDEAVADDAADETPRGAADETHREGADEGGMAMIADPDEYAATEPVRAEDQSPPVERETPTEDLDDVSDESGHGEGATHTHSDTETDDASEGSPTNLAGAPGSPEEASGEDPYDPTPTKDWGADEGELLEENRQRGDQLAEDRADLETEGEASSATPDAGAATSSTDADEHATGEHSDHSEGSSGRRVSDFTELRDGGYGVGSAAPLDDGAQPLDHPVQAYHDTMTFRAPGDPGYDSAEPDVWFYDESAAERSGFSRSEG